jgi:hypothetical protein
MMPGRTDLSHFMQYRTTIMRTDINDTKPISIVFFAVRTMHAHVINKGPINASKYQCISTLVHCYMFQRFNAPSSGS